MTRPMLPAIVMVVGSLAAPMAAGAPLVFERGPTKEEIEAVFSAPDAPPPGALTRGIAARSARDGVRGEASRSLLYTAPEHPDGSGDATLPALVGQPLNIAIQFAFDSASLLLHEGDKLDGLVAYLRENPEAELLIAGHADASGPEGYNAGLSDRRARSVRDFLVDRRGVDARRFVTAGYGETAPLQGISALHPLNRRVEFRLRR
ncbi:MAG: OmpA family protein [Paracoccaceae bacterium]